MDKIISWLIYCDRLKMATCMIFVSRLKICCYISIIIKIIQIINLIYFPSIYAGVNKLVI